VEVLLLAMLDNTITAARADRARIVLPGSVYNFGPDASPDLHEASPQNPVTAKGQIRVEISGGCARQHRRESAF
jgi:hypothetical protein